VVPLLAVLVAIVLLWNALVGWSDIVVLALMYAVTGFGVTVGFHRLLTHRSFSTHLSVHHVTWSINSVCHFFGSRRFEVDDHSTNVFGLAPLSLGESWHHNHHAFPRSAVHGMRWWEIDLTAWVIRAMKAAGLAWNVVEITPERQREKLAAPNVATPA
jgi:fatty-acid desaturase